MSNGKLVSEMLKEISSHDEAVMEILKERSEGYTPIQISKRLKRSYKDVKLSIHRLKIGGHVKNYPWYGRVCLVEFDFLPQLMNKRPEEYAENYREIEGKLATITKQRDELENKITNQEKVISELVDALKVCQQYVDSNFECKISTHNPAYIGRIIDTALSILKEQKDAE